MVAQSSKDEGSSIGRRAGCIRGHNETDHANSDNFFANDPSEYIDSESILPVSESRERLNHFFDETTSTTPAENAKILHEDVPVSVASEPETFGETQVGKFLKNLLAKIRG